MATCEMVVQKREIFGKNHMNRLRAQGLLPAVLYGHQETSLSLSMTEGALKKALQQGGPNVILSLALEGAKEPKTALIKEMQRDPITGKIIHVDLYQISLKDKITVRVPLQVVGLAECTGIRDGGILEHHLRDLEVRCLPTAIPASIPTDISGCKIGDSLHVSDLKIPEGVEVLTSKGEAVLSVTVPTEIVEAVPAAVDAAAAAPTQPEVIGEKEREERRAATDKAKDEKKKEDAKP